MPSTRASCISYPPHHLHRYALTLDDPLPPQRCSRSNPQTTLTTHTPKRVPILAGGDSSTTSSATKRCASASASSSTVRADKVLLYPTSTSTTHSPTKAAALAFPRVVRRVQAVIEVPVKQEEGDDENRVDWPDDSANEQKQPTSTPTGTSSRGGGGGSNSAKRRKSSASSHQRSLAIPLPNDGRRSSVGDDDGEGGEGGGEEESLSDDEDEDEEADDGGEYVDEEEVEIAIASGTPAATTGPGPRTVMVPWGRKHIGHEPDEEDDELMMYAKVEIFPPSPHALC